MFFKCYSILGSDPQKLVNNLNAETFLFILIYLGLWAVLIKITHNA